MGEDDITFFFNCFLLVRHCMYYELLLLIISLMFVLLLEQRGLELQIPLFVYRPWNISSVEWHVINFEGISGGLLVMWNDETFELPNVEFSSQWIGLFGIHVETGFKCVVVCFYDGGSLRNLYDKSLL